MKERIILIGHGSPNQGADELDRIGPLLHRMIHPGCSEDCVTVAYLRHSAPDVQEAIRSSVQRGFQLIIVHPFLLSAGIHVTRDIPEMIDNARRQYPDVSFLCTEHLGFHDKLVEIVMARITAAKKKVSGPGSIE